MSISRSDRGMAQLRRLLLVVLAGGVVAATVLLSVATAGRVPFPTWAIQALFGVGIGLGAAAAVHLPTAETAPGRAVLGLLVVGTVGTLAVATLRFPVLGLSTAVGPAVAGIAGLVATIRPAELPVLVWLVAVCTYLAGTAAALLLVARGSGLTLLLPVALGAACLFALRRAFVREIHGADLPGRPQRKPTAARLAAVVRWVRAGSPDAQSVAIAVIGEVRTEFELSLRGLGIALLSIAFLSVGVVLGIVGWWLIGIGIAIIGGVYDLIAGFVHFATGIRIALGQLGETAFAVVMVLVLLGELLVIGSATLTFWLEDEDLLDLRRHRRRVELPVLSLLLPVAALGWLVANGWVTVDGAASEFGLQLSNSPVEATAVLVVVTWVMVQAVIYPRLTWDEEDLVTFIAVVGYSVLGFALTMLVYHHLYRQLATDLVGMLAAVPGPVRDPLLVTLGVGALAVLSVWVRLAVLLAPVVVPVAGAVVRRGGLRLADRCSRLLFLRPLPERFG